MLSTQPRNSLASLTRPTASRGSEGAQLDAAAPSHQPGRGWQRCPRAARGSQPPRVSKQSLGEQHFLHGGKKSTAAEAEI